MPHFTVTKVDDDEEEEEVGVEECILERPAGSQIWKPGAMMVQGELNESGDWQGSSYGTEFPQGSLLSLELCKHAVLI